MNPCESFRDNIDVPLVVGTAASDQDPARFALPVDLEWFDHEFLRKFRLPILAGAALFSSGLLHLILLCVTGADWSGPLSLRKPALFGISAGLTIWSIAWILTQLASRRGDQRLASFLSAGLLLEVGLITLQQWRGVSSHFNRTTPLDAIIESIMLGLILLVTAGIAWLCWRSRWLRPMAESQVIAIRAGLWLLLASCGLGLLVTIAGEINLAHGHPPEIWGFAGVLKYPHGAVLHASPVPVVSDAEIQGEAIRMADAIRCGGASSVSRTYVVADISRPGADGCRCDKRYLAGTERAVAVDANHGHLRRSNRESTEMH